MHIDDWEWSAGGTEEEKEQKVWQRRAQWLAMMARGMVKILVEEAVAAWGTARWVALAKFPGDWPNNKTSMVQECERLLAIMEEMVEEEQMTIWMAGIIFWAVLYLVKEGWGG